MSSRAIGAVTLLVWVGACASAASQGSTEVSPARAGATESSPLEVTSKPAPAAPDSVAAPPSSATAATPSVSATAEAGGGTAAIPTRTNQLPLGDAKVPFAQYIVAMHGRIHKHFAEKLLVGLDALGPSDPLGNPALTTGVEIELAGKTGRVERLGIIRSSGVTAFDAAVLDSVLQSAPFGPAPASIRSFDGNVYVDWLFHRDPFTSCSTVGATPFLLARP